ncbi:TPA: type II restriction endonuclease, partial [Listeria monocytogenes]|nr:type II restriction endonuclease [Listeria monocytogenes]
NYIVRENEEEYIRISESNTQKLIKKKLEKEDSKNVHQKIQYILATLGNEIGYHAWIASNDHNRMVDGNRLGDVSLPLLPEKIYQLPISLSRTIGLIDVIWFSKNGEPVCAFEVEKSTSIISGMNRMDDLYSIHQENLMMYIVSPNQREEEIR